MREEQVKGWKQALRELQDYVAEHTDIVVKLNSLYVPGALRSRFYELVDVVGASLCAELLGDTAANTLRAAELCASVRQGLVDESDLDEFVLPAALENLLADPHAALAKPLFGLVLDVIQGRIDNEYLLKESKVVLREHNETMFRGAYEIWAYLAVVAALKPRRFFEILSPDTVQTHAVSTGSVTIGSQITSPERRIAEAVFETASGALFAMKTEVARELDYYGAKITRRRDFSAGGNTVDQIAHRVLLLYKLESLDSIPLIADRDTQTVLTTDLMCEVLDAQEIEQESYAQQFFSRIATVTSKRPVQVLCFDDRGEFSKDYFNEAAMRDTERRTLGFSEEVPVAIAAMLM